MKTHQSPNNRILQTIINSKYQEIQQLKANSDLDDLLTKAKHYQPKGFKKTLIEHIANKQYAIISEIKKASPSKGIIAKDFDPTAIAIAYQQAGASCLSVLTDERYFCGNSWHLVQARQAVNLPILRKDFVIDDIQIIQAKALGADCILLIAACLDDKSLQTLYQRASDLGLDVLIEIHDAHELARTKAYINLPNVMMGINNRNLNNFMVDLNNSIRLADLIFTHNPNACVVSESGIATGDDIHLLQSYHINAYLIGETFMKTNNAGLALSQLIDQI